MATFYNIPLAEMKAFLEGQGFLPLLLPEAKERVWGKIVRAGDDPNNPRLTCSLRVYTGIEGGDSRDVGKDAIRVCLFWRSGPGMLPVMVGGSKRVHRVKGWKKNLQDRIDKWEEAVGPACPACGSPMVARKVKKAGANHGRPFYSCVTWKQTKCKGFQWAD